jgi:hypothetical protein
MDELSMPLHTPKIKQQSEQWVKKGQTGPVQAKVHSSRTKRLGLGLLSFQGLIETNHNPKETMINAAYIRIALYILVT